jgi:hypothetical protein
MQIQIDSLMFKTESFADKSAGDIGPDAADQPVVINDLSADFADFRRFLYG